MIELVYIVTTLAILGASLFVALYISYCRLQWSEEKLQHIAEMLEELATELKPVGVSTLLEEAKEIPQKKNLQPLAKKIYKAIEANLGCEIAVVVLAQGERCTTHEIIQAASDSIQLHFYPSETNSPGDWGLVGIKE